MSTDRPDRPDESPSENDQPEMADLYAQLEDLEKMVDSQAAREHVRETMRMAVGVGTPGVFGQIIRGYDRADIAESVLGALLFGIPMFVEGGTNEVGEFVATNPLYFVGTHVLALGVVISIIYVADIQDVRVHRPIFGLVPRRLVGVMTVSFLIAVVMMTGWGRVSWTDPWVAVCTVSVAFVPMAIGAALGDILPGS
ncbi:DUF2391 family protein [Salinibaculum salinum]|uniref:DUF2391 family protein n=1 Tax=Salinibaculum salinum TaxID=3131996 RepID=UPI0030EEA729